MDGCMDGWMHAWRHAAAASELPMMYECERCGGCGRPVSLLACTPARTDTGARHWRAMAAARKRGAASCDSVYTPHPTPPHQSLHSVRPAASRWRTTA
eukprot:364592-Chlamydomonas_euryale.AAC.1